MKRLILFLLAAAPAFAQLELATMPDRTVRQPGEIIPLGDASAGDRTTFVFLVTNTGNAPVDVRKIDVESAGFWILNPPQLPYRLPSRESLEFRVSFEPQAPGSYFSALVVNQASYFLVARAVTGPSFLLEADGSEDPLVNGSVVDFGTVRPGENARRGFTLANRSSETIRLEQVQVRGTGFSGPEGLTPPLVMEPQKSAAFEVVFAPALPGPCEGALTIGGRTIRLTGVAIDPPVPPFEIAIDSANLRSGQQARLRLKFAAKSPVLAPGVLQMDFIGKGDPSVTFLAPAGRSAKFEIRPGEDTARFGEDTSIGFQTGTTEGTIIFTAILGEEKEQASVQIAPEAISVDSVRTVRGSISISVALTGFDNTRSASIAAYTFHDKAGTVIGGGTIRVDVSTAFASYFENPEMGGAFVLRALFPVTGGTSSIDSVDVEITNKSGTSQGHAKIAE